MTSASASLVKKGGVSTLPLATCSTAAGIWEHITLAHWASGFTFEHEGTDNDFNVNCLVSTYKYAWHDF